MCRPLEMVFSSGIDKGVQVSPQTTPVHNIESFDEFFDAYKTHMHYMIQLLVNADNAIDVAHAERCPLPFESCMVSDCISRGKALQEGGAIYNFTGPQGFGIANMADSLWAIKKLVFEQEKYTLDDFADALANNYGLDMEEAMARKLTTQAVVALAKNGVKASPDDIRSIYEKISKNNCSQDKKLFFSQMLEDINSLDKYGNDCHEIDSFAREVAYTYTRDLENYSNPRGGKFQAGLYPVSANVPLGAQTGALPDGRIAYAPVADGVSPASGRDTHGPTAAANSVSRLDH